MRVALYLRQGLDFEAERARIMQLPDVTSVVCRNASRWAPDCDRVPKVDAVCAPEHPQIAAWYGGNVKTVGMPEIADIPVPRELVKLAPAKRVAICAAGPNLARTYDMRPHGVGWCVVAVNRAIRSVAANYWVANDGFIKDLAGQRSDAVRVCRRERIATLNGSEWFDLRRLGVSEGTWTTVCALKLAESLQAEEVRLYGHDAVPGHGYKPGHMASCHRDVMAECRRLAAHGIKVTRYTLDGDDVREEIITSGAPVEPDAKPDATATKKGRKCKAQ